MNDPLETLVEQLREVFFMEEMSEQTIKCPICGDPYKTYSHTVADQSACPSCVKKAEQNMKTQWGKP